MDPTISDKGIDNITKSLKDNRLTIGKKAINYYGTVDALRKSAMQLSREIRNEDNTYNYKIRQLNVLYAIVTNLKNYQPEKDGVYNKEFITRLLKIYKIQAPKPRSI